MTPTAPSNPPTPPPAVVRGLPKAALRSALGASALPLVIGLSMIVLVPLAINLIPVSRLITFGIPLMALPAVVAYVFLFRAILRSRKLFNDLAGNPLACLNCTYPTIDPATHICPECGHHTDRAALNRLWRRNLERRAQRIRAASKKESPPPPAPP